MKRHLVGAILLPGLLLALGAAPVQAQVAGPISHFMTMSVCTATSSPTAPAIQGIAPGDTGCKYTRPIMVGETPPYTMRDFAPNYIAATHASCPGTYGPLLRANVLATINGVTRSVTMSQTGTATTCLSAAQVGGDAGLTDTSVQSSDPSTGYGYIMGDSGPNGISLNDAYNLFPNGATTGGIPSTPVCKTSTPYSAARFANSWVIGLSPVSASLPGPIQFATVNLQNTSPDEFTAEQQAGVTCSTPYVGSFHIWRDDWFMFFSGRQLQTVVAAHYAQAAANNAGPGAAQEMERTYWTGEFGLSRWEKWTRDDLLVNGVASNVTAKQLLSHAVCAQVGRAAGVPYPIVTNASDSHTSGSMVLSSVNGVYQKVVGPDGVSHSWYLTLCADYTNIDRSVTGQPLPAVPAVYDPMWAN
jgi:hypothetical protein